MPTSPVLHMFCASVHRKSAPTQINLASPLHYIWWAYSTTITSYCGWRKGLARNCDTNRHPLGKSAIRSENRWKPAMREYAAGHILHPFSPELKRSMRCESKKRLTCCARACHSFGSRAFDAVWALDVARHKSLYCSSAGLARRLARDTGALAQTFHTEDNPDSWIS